MNTEQDHLKNCAVNITVCVHICYKYEYLHTKMQCCAVMNELYAQQVPTMPILLGKTDSVFDSLASWVGVFRKSCISLCYNASMCVY